MKKIGIIAKPKASAGDILRQVVSWCDTKKLLFFMDKETADVIDYDKAYQKESIPSLVDMVIVMGGDGTLLSIARLCYKHNVPILGVNLGSLGFITSVTQDELFISLDQILGGAYKIEERVMLNAEIYREGKRLKNFTVLNDVVVSRGILARVIELEIFINKNYVARYQADGIMVSTPTGSTAYCLATGGPILYPTINALVLVPICPHTLANRPIVIPDDVTLQIRITSSQEDVYATMDGQEGFKLEYKDRIEVFKADDSIKLIHPPKKDHYQVLRKKLNWGR